jgi:hypothetical protein
MLYISAEGAGGSVRCPFSPEAGRGIEDMDFDLAEDVEEPVPVAAGAGFLV